MNKLIKQPYRITKAKYNIGIHEQRIFIRIIQALQAEMEHKSSKAQIRETLLGDKIISISTKALLPPGSMNYSAIKGALKRLKNRTITIKGSDKLKGSYEIYTGMILKSKYYQNNEMVEIQICREILPQYICLANGFTKYNSSTAFKVSSPYTIRIYQEISHWASTHSKIILKFDEIKQTLELDNKYPRPGQFKQSILLPAQKELKEKADVWFDIQKPIKDGRQVVGWEIQIKKDTHQKNSKTNPY